MNNLQHNDWLFFITVCKVYQNNNFDSNTEFQGL